jgi:hypothetical protein
MKDERYKYVQIEREVYEKVRKLALLNELQIRVLASMLLSEILKDQQKVETLIKNLKREAKAGF